MKVAWDILLLQEVAVRARRRPVKWRIVSTSGIQNLAALATPYATLEPYCVRIGTGSPEPPIGPEACDGRIAQARCIIQRAAEGRIDGVWQLQQSQAVVFHSVLHTMPCN